MKRRSQLVIRRKESRWSKNSEESQGSCSVGDRNYFDERLDDLNCQNIFLSFWKKLEARVTESFYLANIAKENQWCNLLHPETNSEITK